MPNKAFSAILHYFQNIIQLQCQKMKGKNRKQVHTEITIIRPDVFSHSALDLCWNRSCLHLLQLMLACFMERMPNLLDVTVSFTDSPFWSSLTFMHTNPSNLALLFGSNYIQRINSSLNSVANPFHLQPLPQCLIAGMCE